MAKQNGSLRIPKAGDTVHLVLASGKKTPAKITGVGESDENGLHSVDLKFDHGRQKGVVITSSPRDPDGKKHDSWEFPVEEEGEASAGEKK